MTQNEQHITKQKAKCLKAQQSPIPATLLMAKKNPVEVLQRNSSHWEPLQNLLP